MTAYLINHLRQPGVVSSEVLDYLEQVQATLDPFGGKFLVQGTEAASVQITHRAGMRSGCVPVS